MPEAYCIVAEDLEKLRNIKNALFGDGTMLSPDKRRDLANLLSSLIVEIERFPAQF